MFSKIGSFLFKNTTTKQTIIKNTFWLILAEGINKWWVFIITIFIAHILWSEQFWILSFMMAFVGIFTVLTDFWLTTVMVREVSRDQSKLSEYLINLSFIKMLLACITLSLVLVCSQYIWKSEISISLILIYCIYSIVNNFSEFLRAFFRPSEDMQHEAYLKIMNGVFFVWITGFILTVFWDIQSILYGFLMSAVFGLMISIIYIARKFEIKKIHIQKDTIKKVLKQGFFIGIGSFFIALYMSSDQIIMGFYSQYEALGIYALAYKFTLILGMVSGIIFTTLLPKASSTSYLENIVWNYKRWLWLIFRYNFLLILLLEFILLGLYSLNLGQYQAIIPILQFLLLYNLIEPLGYWWYINLVSLGKEDINLYIVMIAWILNVVGNLILIPRYEYLGAIGTTIFSYIFYFICVNAIVLWKFQVKK